MSAKKQTAHPLTNLNDAVNNGSKECKICLKKINCLNEIIRLSNLYKPYSEDLYAKLVSLIPSTFQFPDMTSARILIDNKEFLSENFRESFWELKKEIYAQGKSIGSVQVHYFEEKPRKSHDPFLKEESEFVITLSEYLSILESSRELKRNQRVMEDSIQEAKFEAICKLSRGIAHDFNNLLTIINGYSGFIRDRMDKDNPLYADINEINKAGNLGASAIRRLVTYSNPTKLDIKKIDLNVLVQDMKPGLNSMMGEEIEVVTYLSDFSAHVRVDRSQLVQVLLSFAENAKEAMPEGGRLIVAITPVIIDYWYCLWHKELKPGTYIALTVSDTGSGRPPEIQDRVFDPLCTTKTKRMGVGLGTAAAQRFARKCAGHITVQSHPGKGSQLTLFFPDQKQDIGSDSSMGGTLSEVYRGNETLLIIDNGSQFKSIMAAILRDWGYNVIIATVAEAIQLCQSKKPPIDLIITHIITPEMSGIRLFKSLQCTHPSLKALFIVGYKNLTLNLDNQEYKRSLLRMPIKISRCLARIRKILDGDEENRAITMSGFKLDLQHTIPEQKGTMIISQNESLKKELVDCLKIVGYPVVCQANGIEALTTLKELDGTIDYVIIDPNLEDLSYQDCAMRVSQINPGLQIIFLINATISKHIDIPEKAATLKIPITRTDIDKVFCY